MMSYGSFIASFVFFRLASFRIVRSQAWAEARLGLGHLGADDFLCNCLVSLGSVGCDFALLQIELLQAKG